jgi:hypothetical protein
VDAFFHEAAGFVNEEASGRTPPHSHKEEGLAHVSWTINDPTKLVENRIFDDHFSYSSTGSPSRSLELKIFY